MRNNYLHPLVCNERFLKYYLQVHFELLPVLSLGVSCCRTTVDHSENISVPKDHQFNIKKM